MEDEQQAKASRAKQANRNSLVEICRSITRTAPRACAERMGNGRIVVDKPKVMMLRAVPARCQLLRTASEKAGLDGRARVRGAVEGISTRSDDWYFGVGRCKWAKAEMVSFQREGKTSTSVRA